MLNVITVCFIQHKENTWRIYTKENEKGIKTCHYWKKMCKHKGRQYGREGQKGLKHTEGK